MSFLINNLIGPQVAIVDNNENEVRSIEITLNEMNIGNQFFEVDYTEPQFPEYPLSTIQLVFLDLYYNNASVDFDPYACTDWLKALIPEGNKYILVIWSNDGYKAEELVEVMKETNTPMPYFLETSPKNKYQNADNVYDIHKLLDELNIKLESKFYSTSKRFYGQVIAVEENSVLINCLINEDPAAFEVRRFDLKPFQGELFPKKGMFLNIKITNSPGSKIFDFSIEPSDLSEMFQKADDFEDIDDISFLTDETEEDEDNI